MALAANALTTVATLADELGVSAVTEQAKLERIINTVSDAISKYCDRIFQREVITNERYAGYGTPRIILARRPVVSIQAIDLDGTALDAASYYVEDAEAGIVFRELGFEWTAAVQGNTVAQNQVAGSEEKAFLVDYTGGYILPQGPGTRDLPYDLEQAAIIAAVAMFRARGKYSKLVQMSADGDQRPWYDYILPPNCRALLNAYKRVV